MLPLSRAEMRDWVRIRLGKLPATATGIPGAKVGDPAPHQPAPSNALINQSIHTACALANQEVALSQTQVPIRLSVAAQTATGPFFVPLGENTSIAGIQGTQFNHITWARWLPATGASVPLYPASWADLTAVYPVWADVPPETPRWIVQGMEGLALVPAPSQAGTLMLMADLCLSVPMADGDSLGPLPGDYYPNFVIMAACETARVMSSDAEMQARLITLEPEAQRALMLLKMWRNTLMLNYQVSLRATTHRSVTGGARG